MPYKPNPKAEGEQKFIKKHVTVKHDDPAKNKDDVFNASNVKTVDRSEDDHGYNPGEDEKVYEAKNPLTDDEMAERERIVKGMKKNFASFKAKYGDKAKGVMYATATKMANESVEITESSRADKNYNFHATEARHYLKKISDSLDAHEQRSKSHQPMYGEKGVHWGHVGDVEHVHRQLRDIHNFLSAGSGQGLKEEVTFEESEQDLTEEEVIGVLEYVFESLTEEGLEHIEALVENGDAEELVRVISEAMDELEEMEGAARARAGERQWVSHLAGEPTERRVQHHLKRGGQIISSHDTESQALKAYKDLKDQKGVKIVKEETLTFEESIAVKPADDAKKKEFGKMSGHRVYAVSGEAKMKGTNVPLSMHARVAVKRGEGEQERAKDLAAKHFKDKHGSSTEGEHKITGIKHVMAPWRHDIKEELIVEDDYEQLDELSPATKADYAKKALASAHTALSMRSKYSDPRVQDDANRTISKRMKGIRSILAKGDEK